MSTVVQQITLPGDLPGTWFETARIAYADDPHWIPEDPAAVTREFHPLNPWFRQGRAHGLLVAGKARICMFYDPNARVDGQPVAYFGDFVTTGDAEAEARLFAEGAAWARAQGAARLVGPMHMATWHSYRALVSIEEGGVPFLGEPYDSPAVPRALERLGFLGVQHYRSLFFTREGLLAMSERLSVACQKALDAGYQVRVEPIENIVAMMPQLYDASMALFGGNYAFSPPDKDVWLGGMTAALRRACPLTTMMARDRDGNVAGYCVNFPHWGPLVMQGAQGRMRVDELEFEKHAPLLGAERTVIFKTLGVLREHQRSNVGGLLSARTVALGAEHYAMGVCATMRDDNVSRRYGTGLESFERKYVLYGRDLA